MPPILHSNILIESAEISKSSVGGCGGSTSVGVVDPPGVSVSLDGGRRGQQNNIGSLSPSF